MKGKGLYYTSVSMGEDKQLGGLVNMGLTCYANVVIQAMRHCRKLPWILEEGRYTTLLKKDADPVREKQQTLTKSFANTVRHARAFAPPISGGNYTPVLRTTLSEHLRNSRLKIAMIATNSTCVFWIFFMSPCPKRWRCESCVSRLSRIRIGTVSRHSRRGSSSSAKPIVPLWTSSTACIIMW